jgi:IS4 transposase
MSHQDQGRQRAEGSHADELYRALQWLLPTTWFKGIVFRHDCSWTPRSLAFGALLWAWSDFRPLGERFSTVRKIIKHWFGRQREPAKSYQAFVKLLRKWTEPLMRRLQQAFRGRMQESLASVWRVAGWLVFAADGSRVDVPRTRSNESRYAPKSKLSREAQKRRRKGRRRIAARRRDALQSRQRKANIPQIWLTTLWHVGSGLPWAWRTGPSDSSERNHVEEMLGELPAGALLAADAGFVGYGLWRKILDAGHQLLVRVGGNVRLLKKLGYVRESAGLVYLWPDKVAARNHPPLVLRLVVVNNGRHPVYLATSVLSTAELSDAQAARIYAHRWGIELFYRHCKQTFERRKLRSHNPDNAMVELHWTLLGMWAMGLHSHHRLVEQGVPVKRISFAGVLRAYRLAMREYKNCPDRGERLTELLDKALIDTYRRTNKTSRNYPRKKQEQAAGPPIIRMATDQQIHNAKQLRAELKKRLTA